MGVVGDLLYMEVSLYRKQVDFIQSKYGLFFKVDQNYGMSRFDICRGCVLYIEV